MIEIHDSFYMTDDESVHFVSHDNLLYIENMEDQMVLNKNDVKDLIWFIENIYNKREKC